MLDGSHPIQASELVSPPKPKADAKKAKRTTVRVEWTYEDFRNSAREKPGEENPWRMKRWQKRTYSLPQNVLLHDAPSDYWAVKYNRPVELIQYNDEEYQALLNDDPNWTKPETDYLMVRLPASPPPPPFLLLLHSSIPPPPPLSHEPPEPPEPASRPDSLSISSISFLLSFFLSSVSLSV